MKALHHKQRGFTLIELLVTVGILGLLAVVVVPNVARFVGKGGDEAAKAELASVQTAMDTAMSDLGLKVVTDGSALAITDFSAAAGDIDPGAGSVTLYPNYLRFQTSGGASTAYKWDPAGKVTQTGSWK